jgi:geranylgeranylglycerol-phosphate geranylgeranyltransferase
MDMNIVEAWFRVVRPPIVFISIFGASVGALNMTIAQGVYLDPIALIISLFSSGLLAAGLMVHNDYTDLESDKVNRPHKPLPQGIISPNTANITGIVMMALAVILGFLTTINLKPDAFYLPYGLNLPCGFLTLLVMVIGIVYNRSGKYMGLLGHILVAFGVGVIPYWGAIAVLPTDLISMIPLALAIGVMEVGREIMVCIGDIKGDIKAGFRTTPVRLGRIKSFFVVVPFYLGFIPIFPISYYGWLGFQKIFGNIYLLGAIIFELILIITWIDTYRVVRTGNEKQIWSAFERNIRTGTRVGVIFFQFILFFEVFY